MKDPRTNYKEKTKTNTKTVKMTNTRLVHCFDIRSCAQGQLQEEPLPTGAVI